MQPLNQKNLFLYLFPPISSLFWGGLCIIFGIFTSSSAAHPTEYILFFSAIAILLSLKTIIQIFKLIAFMHTCKRKNLLSEVLSDFNQGTQFIGDPLRMGNTYIIGRGASTAIRYDEIVRVIHHVSKTNYSVSQRKLMITTQKSNVARTLCILPLDFPEHRLFDIMAIINTKNNSVHIN